MKHPLPLEDKPRGLDDTVAELPERNFDIVEQAGAVDCGGDQDHQVAISVGRGQQGFGVADGEVIGGETGGVEGFDSGGFELFEIARALFDLARGRLQRAVNQCRLFQLLGIEILEVDAQVGAQVAVKREDRVRSVKMEAERD